MRTAILQTHSKNNEKLYQITLPNHAEYAGRHEYDMIQINCPYDYVMNNTIKIWEDILRDYDLIFNVGSDVIFTNMNKPLTDFLDDKCGMVIALEGCGSGWTNPDTLLLRKGDACNRLIQILKNTTHDWSKVWTKIQYAFESMYEKKPGYETVEGDLRFAPVRDMQSSYLVRAPNAQWREGDFALHVFNTQTSNKEVWCKKFLETREIELKNW